MNKKTEKRNNKGHNPNHIPSGERTMNIIFSSIMFLYGTFGIIIDDLYIPGKRSPGAHFHGETAWILYGAFLCAIANMMSVVVDHYDQRNNETNYKLFARVTQIAGWTLFVFALVLDIFVFHKVTWH
jgi:O-antigen/teichoic acid export membrane protein